ncbi:MAG: hypothetical protein JW760_07750 [Spirochaetales bacterium]|nr:hypothetical protein [Spirochaetales bacterium]
MMVHPLTRTPRRAGGVLLFSWIFFFFFPAFHYASELNIQLETEKDHIRVSILLPPESRPDILTSFNNGLRSGIRFEIRLYRVATGFRSFFGDQLLREEHIVKEGHVDSFSRAYRITTDSKIQDYHNFRQFQEVFYHLADLSIPFIPSSADGAYYILCRVVVEKMKLVPPLNLLSPFMKTNRIATPWVRLDLSEERAGKEG